uniref:Putative ovule protein n=1 Tax=Solanum chacoense TaxID=4108 RepID=A0A0V0HM91_SOLCH
MLDMCMETHAYKIFKTPPNKGKELLTYMRTNELTSIQAYHHIVTNKHDSHEPRQGKNFQLYI